MKVLCSKKVDVPDHNSGRKAKFTIKVLCHCRALFLELMSLKECPENPPLKELYRVVDHIDFFKCEDNNLFLRAPTYHTPSYPSQHTSDKPHNTHKKQSHNNHYKYSPEYYAQF